MKKVFLLVFAFFIQYSTSAFGWNEWVYKTDMGTSIENNDGISLWSNKHSVEYLVRWYYYKKCIIGEYKKNFDDSTLHYFIYNEVADSLALFDSENNWNRERVESGLVPVLYTRWFRQHGFFWDDLILTLVLGFYFTIPCVLLCCLILYFAIVYEKFKLFKPMTMLTYLLVLLIVVYTIDLNWINSI